MRILLHYEVFRFNDILINLINPQQNFCLALFVRLQLTNSDLLKFLCERQSVLAKVLRVTTVFIRSDHLNKNKLLDKQQNQNKS